MQGFRIYRKNTDQNTAKTPIEMPQKHRLKCHKKTDLICILNFICYFCGWITEKYDYGLFS
jgi:hypothetical protein